MSGHSAIEEFIENKIHEEPMSSTPLTPVENVSSKHCQNLTDVNEARTVSMVSENRYTGGAISYSLKDQTSSDESSDEGPDVYVPSFAIPSHNISHDEPFKSPDSKLENKSDSSSEVEQRNHDYTEDGDRGHSDIEVEKSNIDVKSYQNILFNKNDTCDQKELKNLVFNESKELITGIKKKTDEGNTDIELQATDYTNMTKQCTCSKYAEVTEAEVDKVDNCISEKIRSNNMEITKESSLLIGFQKLGEKNGLNVLNDSHVSHTSAQRENGQISDRGVNQNSCKTDQSETERVQNKAAQNVEPTASPREDILYNRKHSNPGFQYRGQMHNIPPTMPYYPPPLLPNNFFPFQPYLPVRPDWNHQHVQQSKLLDVQPAVSDCKGDNSPDLRETSSKSAFTTRNDDSNNQKEEKRENIGTEHIVNSGTGKEIQHKLQQDNTKEKRDTDELFKSLVDSQSTPYFSERQGSKIVITFSGDISEHTLTYYFENTRKSGGGEIQNMDFSPDTGVAVIVFKDHESAENVLKKNKVHKVSDINLKIHLIERESDLGNILEENIVLVKGINPNTTEGCLWNYLEVNTESEPTYIRYGSDTTYALVMFEDKIDFGRLQEGCRKKPLENYTLTVSRVPFTSCVLVTGLSSKVSRNAEQYYFANERRSGGDENLQMVEFNSTTCVIRFPSPLVAKRVCDKKEQRIGGCLLEVCLYYDFFGRKKNVENLDPEILLEDTSVLKFLKYSPKLKQKIVFDAEGKAFQKSHSSTKIISYTIYNLQLMWRLKCFDTLMERFPGVDAQCNLDKREVTLSGNIAKMKEAELYLRETENSFARKPFQISKNKTDLLSKKGARDIWYQETKKKQIIATWNVDHGACEMYAQTNEEVERAIICMEDLFLEDEILDSDKFTQSSRWVELLKKLNERDQNSVVIKSFHGKIQLAANKYIFHEIKSDIEKDIDKYAREKRRRVIVDVVSEQPMKHPGKNTGITDAMMPIQYLHHKEQRTASSSADFITVVKGLITERQVDVIVNSIRHDFDLSHGSLSRSILNAAGDLIQTEIYQHAYTFLPSQNVVATSGGKMNCRMIIHGTLDPFDGPDGKSVKILQQFIDNCLRTSAEMGMRSIAFPAVGTGVLKFPVDIVAKVMFERVIAFEKKNPDSSIQKVEFVIFPPDVAAIKAFDDFQQRLTRQDTSHRPDDICMAQAPVYSEPRTPRQMPMNKGCNNSAAPGGVNVVDVGPTPQRQMPTYNGWNRSTTQDGVNVVAEPTTQRQMPKYNRWNRSTTQDGVNVVDAEPTTRRQMPRYNGWNRSTTQDGVNVVDAEPTTQRQMSRYNGWNRSTTQDGVNVVDAEPTTQRQMPRYNGWNRSTTQDGVNVVDAELTTQRQMPRYNGWNRSTTQDGVNVVDAEPTTQRQMPMYNGLNRRTTQGSVNVVDAEPTTQRQMPTYNGRNRSTTQCEVEATRGMQETQL